MDTNARIDGYERQVRVSLHTGWATYVRRIEFNEPDWPNTTQAQEYDSTSTGMVPLGYNALGLANAASSVSRFGVSGS